MTTLDDSLREFEQGILERIKNECVRQNILNEGERVYRGDNPECNPTSWDTYDRITGLSVRITISASV